MIIHAKIEELSKYIFPINISPPIEREPCDKTSPAITTFKVKAIKAGIPDEEK